MSRILLGVSGGIAAYKALELVRLATAAGHAVRVVQTPASRRFVGAASFAALSGAPVLMSEFERDPARGTFPDQSPPEHEPLSHLALVANADVYLIAPASANTIAKLAAGLADSLLTSCALAAGCPLLLAPAMNNRMYEHLATQANLRVLRERGAIVIEPDVGRLASKGEQGVGRLAEPERVLAACEDALAREAREDAQSLAGVRVLVSAGGTREPIDSVRFLGNSSSGRMGLALARAARERGAQVTLVAANVALPTPAGVRRRDVGTAAELQQACEQEFPDCDVLLMAAAVADFTPAQPANGKLKKSQRECLQLVLEPTADILAGLAAHRRGRAAPAGSSASRPRAAPAGSRPGRAGRVVRDNRVATGLQPGCHDAGQTLVGFAAEHGESAIENARAKLAQKGLDAIVVNDISRADIGFDVDDNEVTILTYAHERHVPRTTKALVAEAILDTVESLRASG